MKGNKPIFYASRITLLAFVLFTTAAAAPPAEPAPDKALFTSSTGLRVKIIHNPNMQFIHAQLVIYYKDTVENPAIPYLTSMNIFNPQIDKGESDLLNTMKKMGNDFTIENRPDFLYIKMNFIPEQFELFYRFIKNIFHNRLISESLPGLETYSGRKQARSLAERFNDSISNFWKYFFSQNDWKQQIAFQIAYEHFFAPSLLGRTFITPSHLKNITLKQVLAFYRETYNPNNALLIIKGNFPNRGVLFGFLELKLKSFKKKSPYIQAEKELPPPINNQMKVVIYNVQDTESPIIYWFEAISTFNNRNPIPSLVLNNIFFAYPTGRLFMNARESNINQLRIETQMVSHVDASIICNTIRVNYRDLTPFFQLVEREKKRLQISRIDRPEFANTVSFIYGRLKVNTQNYDNDANQEIINTSYSLPPITLAGFNQAIDATPNSMVVIVGNSKLILKWLDKKIPIQVVDF